MKKQQPLVYICGPYRAATEWQVEENIRAAERAALEVWRLGAAVICPHKNTERFGGAQPDEAWLSGDLTMLDRCDAVFVIGNYGQSAGSIAELRRAKDRGIPIFFALTVLRNWIDQYEGSFVGLRFHTTEARSDLLGLLSTQCCLAAAEMLPEDELKLMQLASSSGLFRELTETETGTAELTSRVVRAYAQSRRDQHSAATIGAAVAGRNE